MTLPRPPLLALLGALALGGCANTIERLSQVGKAPDLSPIENPVAGPAYQPVTLPMPAVEPEIYPANSLWRQGARSFFKDQRARTIGDVVTVQVTIADEATLRNETRRTRENSDDLSASTFFGFESKLGEIFPDAVDPTNLVDLNSELEQGGRGNTARNEEIELRVGYGGRGQITDVQQPRYAPRCSTSSCRIDGAGSNGERPWD
jgi:flagellar L-ring protein precursor FlgH